MLNVQPSIATGFGKGELYPILKQLQDYGIGIQGEVYFVEGNAGSNGNDGSSWDKAFKTLTYALAISHANIAAGSKGWASRNTIFCKGDSLDEDLAALAQKTDIVGVGSCNNIPKCRLIGTHTIAAATWAGCRFFNMEFMDDGASSNWTFSQGGFEFHNCVFRCDASSTAAITVAIPHDVKIIECEFLEDVDGNPFDTVAIAITGGAYNCQIRNNYITGDLGITIGAGTYHHCRIDKNVFYTEGMCINDASSLWQVTNNQLLANVDTSTPANICTSATALACNNICTGSTGGASVSYPVIT